MNKVKKKKVARHAGQQAAAVTEREGRRGRPVLRQPIGRNPAAAPTGGDSRRVRGAVEILTASSATSFNLSSATVGSARTEEGGSSHLQTKPRDRGTSGRIFFISLGKTFPIPALDF